MAAFSDFHFMALGGEEAFFYLLKFAGIILWLTLTWIFPLVLLFYGVYFLVSLPLRRQERARLFLDLLEMGLKQGSSVENTIIAASQSRDSALGVRFHLLAAYLEMGRGLIRSLERVPRLLPPQIVAMLKVGAEIGDLGKVLPACRNLMKDGISQVTKGSNHLIMLAFVVTPVGMAVLLTLAVWVYPRLIELAGEMGANPPALMIFLLAHKVLIFSILAVVWSAFYLSALLYVGGPRLFSWISVGFPFVLDAIFYRIPWKRKRMQRDFSAMLAILLDAGVPEEKALKLAAESTANRVLVERSEKAVARLRQGVKLTEAIQELDDSGEFRWRLTNAVHAQSGFFAALTGWHEALDARAFQQEQALVHVVTSSVVLLNGVFVGMVAVSVFQLLTSIVKEGLLW